MNIAILSDIHGNVDALEAVLETAKKENVAKLLILGDVVGYYYHPKEVIELICNWEYSLIKGNHEEILSTILSGKIMESDIRLKYGSGHRMAIEQLSAKQLQLLVNAPEQLLEEHNGIKILMCHGSPWQTDFYLYPDTEKEILNKCLQFNADLIFVGHSHYSFVYNMSNMALINCGSVGQSRNLGGYASWALLNTDNKTIQLKATPYDTRLLIKEIEVTGPDVPYLKNILLRK